MSAPERTRIGIEQVLGDVLVEAVLRGRHRVAEELGLPLAERLVHELLRLSTQGALADGGDAAAQLVVLALA